MKTNMKTFVVSEIDKISNKENKPANCHRTDCQKFCPRFNITFECFWWTLIWGINWLNVNIV